MQSPGQKGQPGNKAERCLSLMVGSELRSFRAPQSLDGPKGAFARRWDGSIRLFGQSGTPSTLERRIHRIAIALDGDRLEGGMQ